MIVRLSLRKLLLSPAVPAFLTAAAIGTAVFWAPETQTEAPSAAAEPAAVIAETDAAAASAQRALFAAEVHDAERAAQVRLTAESESAAAKAEASRNNAAHQVAVYVNKAFRVPMQQARQVTEWAIEIGKARDVDPLLILAVIGTESSFNPDARSGAGAEGLMQVVTNVHKKKFRAFGGRQAAFDPYANIAVGTDILSYLIKRTGSVNRALKYYSGAANMSHDNGYGNKVLKEHSLLSVAALGDTDRAVSLHKSRKGAPEQRVSGNETLGFSNWSDLLAESSEGEEEAQSGPDSWYALLPQG
jgi:soluble lytic murein transglycosylase-like protein